MNEPVISSTDVVVPPISQCEAYLTKCENVLPDGSKCGHVFNPAEDFLLAPDTCPKCEQPRQRCRSYIYSISRQERGTPNFCYTHYHIGEKKILAQIANVINSEFYDVFNDLEIYFEEHEDAIPETKEEIALARTIMFEGCADKGTSAKERMNLIRTYMKVLETHSDIKNSRKFLREEIEMLLYQEQTKIKVREQAYMLYNFSQLYSPNTREFRNFSDIMSLKEPTLWNHVLQFFFELRARDAQIKAEHEMQKNAIESTAVVE